MNVNICIFKYRISNACTDIVKTSIQPLLSYFTYNEIPIQIETQLYIYSKYQK